MVGHYRELLSKRDQYHRAPVHAFVIAAQCVVVPISFFLLLFRIFWFSSLAYFFLSGWTSPLPEYFFFFSLLTHTLIRFCLNQPTKTQDILLIKKMFYFVNEIDPILSEFFFGRRILHTWWKKKTINGRLRLKISGLINYIFKRYFVKYEKKKKKLLRKHLSLALRNDWYNDKISFPNLRSK